MANYNKVILMGYVGETPTVRTVGNDVKVANLSLAVTEKGYTTKKESVIPDRTDWFNLVAWRGVANVVEKYVKKGSNIHIEGKLKTSSYDKDGVIMYKTEIEISEIQLLDKK